MVHFHTQTLNFGIFWKALTRIFYIFYDNLVNILRGRLIYLMALCYIFVICYTFPSFGTLYQEKSGNPGTDLRRLEWLGFKPRPVFSFSATTSLIRRFQLWRQGDRRSLWKNRQKCNSVNVNEQFLPGPNPTTF
jgi:hypothetical protein